MAAVPEVEATTPLKNLGATLSKLTEKVGVLLPLSALILLVVFFSLTSDVFLSEGNFWNIVRQSSVLLIVALGLTFVILMGAIDLSVASTVTLTAIVAATLYPVIGDWGVLVALLAALLCGMINGLLNAYFKLPSFLVTLGTLFVFEGVGLIIAGGRPVAWDSSFMDTMMGGTVLGPIPKIGLWALAIFGVCIFIALKTRFGRYIFAIGDGERTSQMSGIPTVWVKFGTFAMCSLIAGIGGIMLGVRSFSASPGMGEEFLLDSIAAVVLGGTLLTGGIGGPQRTIFGVLVIVVLANGMTLLQVDPFFQVVISGAVVIAAVALTMRKEEKGHVVK